MLKPYDLFKIDAVGDPLWLGAAENLDEATDKAKIAHQSDPNCEYCVINQETGAKITLLNRALDQK